MDEEFTGLVQVDGDGEDSPPRLNLLTREKAQAGSEIEQKGWVFDLLNTLDADGKPQQALVHRVSSTDTDRIEALPTHVQKIFTNVMDGLVFDAVNEEQQRKGHKKAARKKLTKQQFVDNVSEGLTLASVMCVMGFIEPKVFWTEAEAEEHGGVWVEDIHPGDRIAFNQICQSHQGVIAARLTPFLGEPTLDVPHHEPVHDIPGSGVAEPGVADTPAMRELGNAF